MTNTRQLSRRTPSGQPNPIDVYVGARLRLRRSLLGLSQEALGAALGLTFQQVQKYERGANRIGASRLFDLARALGVDVDYFYEDMGEEVAAASPRTLIPPLRFTGARRMRFKAKWRTTAKLCAALPVRARIWSSPKATSMHQCRLFSTRQCRRTARLIRTASAGKLEI